MLFREISGFFDQIEHVSSRLEMTLIVAKMFSAAKPGEIQQLIYLSQGLLGPSFKGLEAGLGEKLLMESISKATGFSRKEIEKKFKEKGDLGVVVEEISAKKKQTALFSSDLTLEKVFSNLQKIATTTGKGSQELKLKLVAELFNSGSPTEAKFIARMCLGNMRLGIGDPSIMDALALNYSDDYVKTHKKEVQEIEAKLKEKKDEKRKTEFALRVKQKTRELIESYYNVHPDLGEIARAIKEKGLAGLKETKISPGIPIRPTLAERLNSAQEIVEKLGKCIVEQKYDGFRLQIHKNLDTVKIFSRQNENVTDMFPEIADAVKKQVKAKKAIVEGEALAVNEATQEFFPFQVTIQRKRKYEISEKAKELPLKVFLFDVMLVENESMLEKPFAMRRKKLREIVEPGPTIELTEAIETDKAEEIDRFFEESLERGLEGIIAKDLNAKYIAGARKFAWIKLKRSYKGELQDSVDVVVIGYYKGKGKRTQFGLGGLLSAVYNDETGMFESVAKIGTGMTEQRMTDLESALSKIKSPKKPASVLCELEPDQWVFPQMVIEVRADEITKSPTHMAGKTNGAGYALRFPRMISIRTDKKPQDATTSNEIIKMFKLQKHVKLEEKGNA